MGDTTLAAMGVVVEWSSGMLLFLLFVRLSRSGAPRSLMRIWMAAWAVQVVSITGLLVHSVAVLLGDPRFGAAPIRWLGPLNIPGTMLFAGLAALGAFHALGRQAGAAVARYVVLTAIAAGAVVFFINDSIVTGSAMIAITIVAFFGSTIGVARLERRERPRRFPLLAVALFIVGAVTVFYQLGAWFGQLLWPLDDFAATFGWSAGYSSAAVSMILAGTVIAPMVDDAFRGAAVAPDEAVDPPLELADAAVGAAVQVPEPMAAEPVAPEPVTPEPMPQVVVELIAIVGPPAPIAEEFDAPPVRGRTATLPRPPLHGNGQVAEVYLIDDEASVRSTLARIFQRGGWPVSDASTGEEALAWLLDVPIDVAPAVIVCDFTMPGMGGRDLHTHLARERPELVARLMFLSDDDSLEAAEKFVAGTSCPVVEKPFTVSEIAHAVEQVLAASLPVR